jgi:hypothetical protein
MTAIQADVFAEAVLQRCAELLYTEVKPQIEARTAARRRKSATPAKAAAPTPARSQGGTVVSLTAYRTRKAAAAA